MGRSLGSASAAHISYKRDSFDGCIIESGFATEYPLLRLMGINAEHINFDLSDGFENLKKFKSYTKPLLVIHADLDNIVPLSQAEMIMIESNSPVKDIYTVKGADHNNILYMASDFYFKKIKSFIDML